jgi:DNA-binding transcriptional MerR regulator
MGTKLVYKYIWYYTKNMPKKYLNVNEVAKLLGVTPLTVRNWDKKGALVAYRNPLNNYRMYKIEDVELLMRRIEQSRGKGSKAKMDIF